jgi:hypothetical protein
VAEWVYSVMEVRAISRRGQRAADFKVGTPERL